MSGRRAKAERRAVAATREEWCRVYWGTHGCHLPRGHDGPHLCDCAYDEGVDPCTRRYPDGTVNVGAPPYYDLPEGTHFYGPDTTETERNGEAGPWVPWRPAPTESGAE